MSTLERRFRDWQRNRADMRLFRHLSEVHELAPESVELLTELADHHRLVRASELFLRPSLLASNPTRHPDELLDQVRTRLFGSLAVAIEPAPPPGRDEPDRPTS